MPSYLSNTMWMNLYDSALKPDARGGVAGGIFENKTHLFLTFGSGGSKKYSDVYSYDVTQHSWYKDFADRQPYSIDAPHPRDQHSATMIDEDTLLVFGGCLSGGESGGPCPSGDSWLFDGKRKTWEQLMNCAPPRVHSSMAMVPYAQGKRRVIVYGGNEEGKQVLKTNESPDDEIALFNPDTKGWTLRKTTGVRIPVQRMSAALTTGVNGVYMFGGANVPAGNILFDDLWLLRGDASLADKAETSTDCRTYGKSFVNLILLHGILMVLGWGFFLQIGAIFARYLRTKDPLWYHLHRFCQVTGLVCAIGGVIVAFFSVQGQHLQFIHGILGIIVMILGILQPLGAILRPREPVVGEFKSSRRYLWEAIHIYAGRISLLLGLVTISLGLILAVPHQVLWITWFGYVGFLVVLYVCLELYKRLNDRQKRATKQITKDKFYANLLNDAYTRTNSRRTSIAGKTISQVESPRLEAIMKGIVNGGFEAPKEESTLELSQQEINQFGERVIQPRPLSDVEEEKSDKSSRNSEPIYDNVAGTQRMNAIIEEELEKAEQNKAANISPPPIPVRKVDTEIDLTVTGTFETEENAVDIDDIFKSVPGTNEATESTSSSGDEVPFTRL